ncbi:peptidase [Streptomyces abyssalis]|uniref:Peptidase n=1 Tax=Streptomyces abyssalis TaxID=933944 RepID=A0A1E7JHR6_9ACTN|nr:M23 family metallopeptidase [Streptomyces abyssalis]OEU86026.1 peptidase [Streptomyces abyssalis]OEU92508.1 peptidase [Streptomyces abyssalis]OEV06148.1 peptidase [Streptomyces nanshensis]
MAFIRATGTHRRTRPKSRRAKAAGIAGLTVGVVGTLATPALAGTGQTQTASGAAEKSVQETRDEAGHEAGKAGSGAGHDTGLSRAVGFGDSIAETVSEQAQLQKEAAAQAKAANEAKRKAAADKAKREREAEEKAERAARAKERAKLNAYVAPLEDASLSTPYQSSGGLWSSGSHTGVDFSAGEGTEVRSVASGEVVEAGSDGSFGNSIVIKHRDGTYTQYGHLSSLSVSAGQTVKAGQQIALSGSTGNTTGPHLHFEARTGADYGSDMDPVAYLRKHGVDL